MNKFFYNDIFTLDGTRYRVVHIDPKTKPNAKLYGFPIDAVNGLPVGWDINEFSSLPPSRLMVIGEPLEHRPLCASLLAKEVQARRWSEVRSLIEDNPHELMERGTRAKAIARHCEKVGKSDRHMMTLLRMLWRFGINKSSLAADFDNCGRITLRTRGALVVDVNPPTGPDQVVFAPSAHRSRGRRPVFANYEPYSYPPDFRQKLIEEIRKEYLKDEIVTVGSVRDRLMKRHFSKVDSEGQVMRDERGRVRLLPLGKRPTNDQLTYLIHKSVPTHEAFAARVGDAPYRNNVQKSDGTVHDDSVGPGDVYELDATIVDLWLVSRYHRSVIVGKATLYLIVDRSSDLIVGFYLSLRKPSWEGAKRAILSIASDWKALCKSAGVKYDERDWPAHRVYPNRFFVDQGEGASEKSNVVVDIAGIEITAAPGASPRKKSRVEGTFAMVHVPIKDLISGYEPPKNARKRLAKKYFKDAQYTLDEFVRPLLLAIIKHNHTIRDRAVLHPSLVYSEFEASPINIWNHGIEHSVGRAARHDFEYMRQQLLPVGTGRAVQGGIEFGDLLYKFDAPRYDVLLAYAGKGLHTEMIVQYDPGRAGEVWVSERKNPSVTYKARLTSRYRFLEKATWEEVEHYQERAKKLANKGRDTNQELRIGMAIDVEDHDNELKQRTKAASHNVPMGTRLSVGKKARVIEAAEREQDHITSMTAETVAIQGYRTPDVEEPIEFAEDEVEEQGEPDALDPHAQVDADTTAAAPEQDVAPSTVSRRSSTSRLMGNLLGSMGEKSEHE